MIPQFQRGFKDRRGENALQPAIVSGEYNQQMQISRDYLGGVDSRVTGTAMREGGNTLP